MGACNNVIELDPVAHLTAEELLRVVDRSHPHIDAMAAHLERMLDALQIIKRRMDSIAGDADSVGVHAQVVRDMAAFRRRPTD